MIEKLKIKEFHVFSSPIYVFEEKKFLKKINKLCEPYLKQAKKNNKQIIKEREKIFNKKIKDFGLSHHSKNMYEDENFNDFCKFIGNLSVDILDRQGFDLINYRLDFTEMWVQEFSLNGGGHHDTHTHYNNHISGFYFLKCSEKTSFPIFHDPRSGAMMSKLPVKNPEENNLAISNARIFPKPGTFIFFNSYLPHQYTVDSGIEPFRFIHFNLQALPIKYFNV